MSVSRAYLLHKPSGPGPLKVAFDQKVIPALIDAVGGLEGGLEAVARRVRVLPLTGLFVALGTGALLGLLAIPARD